MRFSTLASAAALFELSIAGYVLEDDYMTDFFGGFNFFTGADPTEGFVDYVDEATARQTNLINASSSSVVQWGVDVQNQTPNGRPSVRIESKKTYDSGLIVLDVEHMPFGCGTWPAFWTVGPNWPNNGEIDIVEGVNEQTNNGMTLHTGPGCQIGQDSAQFSGTVTSDNCDVAAYGQPKNTGCSIKHPSTKSYGGGLNAIGGGIYATQWTSEAISIYFFPRGSEPADVLGDSPDPSGWGKPAAKFTGGCDIAETFKKQQLVFDTTFCGQWAGSEEVWNDGSCGKKASTCEEWVRDNPEAFNEAYWTINALKVYQDNGEAPAYKPSAIPSQSTAISKPLPVPTISSRFPTIAPPLSSAFAYPTNSVVPSGPSAVPSTSDGVLAPTTTPSPDDDTSPELPSQPPRRTRSATTSTKPTPPIGNRPAAPTGANGMSGFRWPVAALRQPDGSSPTTTLVSATKTTSTSIPSDTTASSPTPAIESPAPTPTDANDAPSSIPSVPVATDTAEPVQTVYETVYATVTIEPAATPVPDGKKTRLARHIREHRQRLTRHNVARM